MADSQIHAVCHTPYYQGRRNCLFEFMIVQFNLIATFLGACWDFGWGKRLSHPIITKLYPLLPYDNPLSPVKEEKVADNIWAIEPCALNSHFILLCFFS